MKRDWTGRRWLQLGPLAIGFGPVAFIERIWWRGKVIYADYAAYLEGVRRRRLAR